MDESEVEALHFAISGRVQGVFFRASCVQEARRVGADGWVANREDGTVEAVFERRLRAVLPLRADAVMNRIRRMRGGGPLSGGRPGQRMRGQGAAWAATAALFDLHARRLGFGPLPERRSRTPFRRPGRGVQVGLFDGG